MANLSKMQYIAVGISAVTLPILLYLLLKSDRKSMFHNKEYCISHD